MAAWVIRSIFLWIVVGAGLGLIGINAIAPFLPRAGGSMNWYAAAQMYSPLVGAAWGLVAGVIGSLTGAVFRSVQGYALTMVTLAVVPYLPFLGDIEQRGMPTLSNVTYVLIAGLTGVVAWWVAKRNGPPPRSSAS